MYMYAEERKKELIDQNKMNGLMFKRVIWKLSINEFLQLWNILKGGMRMV